MLRVLSPYWFLGQMSSSEGGSSTVTAGGSSDVAATTYTHDRRVIVYPVRFRQREGPCLLFPDHPHMAPPRTTPPLQAYINSKISTAKGRKMPIAHSCEFPTVFEIVEVLKHLGYENPLIEVRPTFACASSAGASWVRGFFARHELPPPCRRRTKRILAATFRSAAVCVWSSRTRSRATPLSRT